MAIKNPEAGNSTAEESQINKRIHKGSGLNVLLAFLVIGLAIYGTFLNFQKGAVLTHTSELEQQNKDIQKQIDDLKGSKVEVSQNATDALAKIKAEEIHWSEVIDAVNKLIPTDPSGKPKIQILSYSGSGAGKISLNVVSQPTSLPAFDDVAGLLSTFNNSVFFQNAYVPAISKGINEDGSVTLSFVMNMDYQKADTGSEDLNLQQPTTNTPAAPKVAAPQSNTATDATPKVPANNQ